MSATAVATGSVAMPKTPSTRLFPAESASVAEVIEWASSLASRSVVDSLLDALGDVVSVCIPENVTLRIFERRYGTKAGTGRGPGTASMKLIGERYLVGRVSFTSGDEGTQLTFRIPG